MRQEPQPIQPVDTPVICKPYDEPSSYWEYERASGKAKPQPGRRPSAYWYKVENAGPAGQQTLELEEDRRPLQLVNKLRRDVAKWRASGWRGATNVTKDLLRHWLRPDRPRRLFFCQVEAAETIIYLNEIRGMRRDGTRGEPRFTPEFTDADFDSLLDRPFDPSYDPMTRMCSKLATGAGKTVVMAMIVTWAFCNRGRMPSDTRFPRAALICCPNLTIKERLQVLRTDSSGGDYYTQFEMVPPQYADLIRTGKVLVTNWHAFAPESEHDENGKSYKVVNKGPESDEAFAQKRLGELAGMGPILCLNDEAHHAYRPRPEEGQLFVEDADDNAEATIWVQGLDRINRAVGIQCCVDLSATPFYIKGSGYDEGEPFPWIVSDFGLVDAIESGITKIPRLPVSDDTGRPDPKYFRLWKEITQNLAAAQRLSNKRPKPDVVWERAEDALQTLAGEYQKAFEVIEGASDHADKTPPVMILVCDNTDMAQLFFEKISGQTEIEDATAADDSDEEGEGEPAARTKKAKKRTVYNDGSVFPELFSNGPGELRTLRIDSKLLEKVESEDPTANRDAAARELRDIVNTVGKRGEPGQHVRCVVSVAMLTEGWDANNVTHILGLRAFGSQLLCEQVVGRGLRRRNYDPDPQSGLLPEEYVDVYGIPFSVIPYKGKKSNTPAERPVNRVRALPERAEFEMRFPNVEGYVYALSKPRIYADIDAMERLSIDQTQTPTAVFVRMASTHSEGSAHGRGFGEFVEHNRDPLYAETHLQRIEFEIATQVVADLVGEGIQAAVGGSARRRGHARHQLFPHVARLVHRYVARKVDWNGADPRELGLDRYQRRIKERLIAAIQPDESLGETPLLPLLNRFKPIGSTADVDFTTTRPVHSTMRSHVDAVVLDSDWEQTAAFHLERLHNLVSFYVRNDRPFLLIPYEYEGVTRVYEPDYILRLACGTNLLLEIKGQHGDAEGAKHQAARRWCTAVNNWGQLGRWDFLECRNPHELPQRLKWSVSGDGQLIAVPLPEAAARVAEPVTLPATPPMLSKTDFNAGLQCEKRLWLSRRQPELAAPPSPSGADRRDAGIEIGRLARLRYPGGLLIQWSGDTTTGDSETRSAIARGADCIFEATFRNEATGQVVRCDVLQRLAHAENSWHLIEVKSGTSPKPEYITDVAFQVAAVRGAGLNVERVSILHIDNQYDYDGAVYDPQRLFVEADVTERVNDAIPGVNAAVHQFQSTLEAKAIPQVETNKHCDDGPCPFYCHCHAGQPKNDVVFLPRISAKQVTSYRQSGFRTIDALPEQQLKPQWKTAWSVVKSGEPWYGPGLAAELARAVYPIHFVDFETVAAGTPLYPHTRPYQQIPFQWSNHILDAPGSAPRHGEFLHTARTDPREAFAESLWRSTHGAGTIIVYYSPFESTRVKELRDDGIPFGPELFGAFGGNLLDLWKVVKDHVYDPDFKGSFSIKDVLPALIPAFSYSGLAINNGELATLRFMEMVGMRPASEPPEVIASQLLEYCALDTLAMVKIFEHLTEAAARPLGSKNPLTMSQLLCGKFPGAAMTIDLVG